MFLALSGFSAGFILLLLVGNHPHQLQSLACFVVSSWELMPWTWMVTRWKTPSTLWSTWSTWMTTGPSSLTKSGTEPFRKVLNQVINGSKASSILHCWGCWSASGFLLVYSVITRSNSIAGVPAAATLLTVVQGRWGGWQYYKITKKNIGTFWNSSCIRFSWLLVFVFSFLISKRRWIPFFLFIYRNLCDDCYIYR